MATPSTPAPQPTPASITMPKSSAPIAPTPKRAPEQRTQPEPSTPAALDGSLKNDIAGILKGAKLPERRDAETLRSQETKRQFEVKQFDTVLGANAGASEAQKPAAAPAPKAQPQEARPQASASAPKPQDKTLHSVHTLKDDLQNVVRDEKISLVRAVSLEQGRRARTPRGQEDVRASVKARSTKRVTGIIFSVILLVLLGVGALFGVYTIEQAHSGNTPNDAASASSLLFAETTVAFPLDDTSPDALKQKLAQARNAGGALGSITQIVPTAAATDANGNATTRPATFAEFMSALGAKPPAELLRALGSDFFFGIHTVDKNAPIIIVPVTSYDRAFAGMLAWEPTLNTDLAPVFTPVPTQKLDEASGLSVLRTFSDVVMRNYDVRALKDDTGTIELYYSFPSQKILIIAESPYTFTEVLSRLQAQHKL